MTAETVRVEISPLMQIQTIDLSKVKYRTQNVKYSRKMMPKRHR